MQKALVIGELLKMSDEFQVDQQRIKDEGNRKRAEATKAQEFKGNQYTVIETQKEVVVPTSMAAPPKPEFPIHHPPSVVITATPEQPIPPITVKPAYTPPAKTAKQPERTTAVIATKIGVNRGAVEQAQTIQEKRPDLAEKVKSGEMKPGEVEGSFILLDGHNRYEICQNNSISFQTTEINVPDRQSAINWIINNQLGRRNLHPDQASYLRGKRYNAEKLTKADAGAIGGSSKDQNDPCLPESTADRLATEYKVSAPTVKRDGNYAAAIDTLQAAVPLCVWG